MNHYEKNFKIAEFAVTTILDTGTGFGILLENSEEQVFIPGSLGDRVPYNPGDLLRGRLIPNRAHVFDPEKAKWMAIFIEQVPLEDPRAIYEPEPEQEPASEPVKPLAERILDVMDRDPGGLWTVKQLADILFEGDYTDAQRVSVKDTLERLHKNGHRKSNVLRVQMSRTGTQSKASFVGYALDESDFIGLSEHEPAA